MPLNFSVDYFYEDDFKWKIDYEVGDISIEIDINPFTFQEEVVDDDVNMDNGMSALRAKLAQIAHKLRTGLGEEHPVLNFGEEVYFWIENGVLVLSFFIEDNRGRFNNAKIRFTQDDAMTLLRHMYNSAP